jgi:hypothetical protein
MNFIFQRVTECLITMRKYNEAKDLVQAEIKKEAGSTLVNSYFGQSVRSHERRRGSQKNNTWLPSNRLEKQPQNTDDLARAFIGYSLFPRSH